MHTQSWTELTIACICAHIHLHLYVCKDKNRTPQGNYMYIYGTERFRSFSIFLHGSYQKKKKKFLHGDWLIAEYIVQVLQVPMVDSFLLIRKRSLWIHDSTA